MVLSLLREQNAQLQEELERLRNQTAKEMAGAAMSTPSSWETVEGVAGGRGGGHEGSHGHDRSSGGCQRLDRESGHQSVGHHVGAQPPRTPRRRSPSTKRPPPTQSKPVQFTPNGTQILVGPPPQNDPFPPFPTRASADISLLQGYEVMESKHHGRGDSNWIPLSMREGKVFMPQEDREARLEREVAELKPLLECLKGDSSWPAAACSKDVPPAPPTGSYGLPGHDFQGLRGPAGEGGTEPGQDGVLPS